jgi:hypothetical protein
MKTLEATIVSDCGRYKVEIERRAANLLEIIAYKWTEEVVPGYGKIGVFWERIPQNFTFTDTLETAQKLALEKLRLYPDETHGDD